MAQRRVIVNADDLGLCPSVNTAIYTAFRAGNLSSATLMVNMPGTADAAARSSEAPGLAIGLHFCLTEGASLTGPSSLTDAEGNFRDRSTLVRRVAQGRIDAGDVHLELEAQLARMRGFGIRPSHVDSHQHVHMVPPIFAAMLQVLHREDLPVRIVDPPEGAVARAISRPRKAIKQWMNARFARIDRARFRGRSNDVLVSVHDLGSPGPYDRSTYRELITATLPDQVVELMVHPYIMGEDVRDLYAAVWDSKGPFIDRCLAEYEVLSGPPVFEGMKLITPGER
ncbi:MAG: ChbG/HpnK family deacetylase [Flavobacteriales bacterium]|nr:ChbG/HpnK family deacetylase [Flavobacteriales bacterium]MCB9167635.1 ChbG/HpnK family deacetylase [Flavobacteriales bacterium]